MCRSPHRCGYCAERDHSNDQCPARGEGSPSHYVNYKSPHPAWVSSCPKLHKSRERVGSAYINRLTRFATPGQSHDKVAAMEFNLGWIIVPTSHKRRNSLEDP